MRSGERHSHSPGDPRGIQWEGEAAGGEVTPEHSGWFWVSCGLFDRAELVLSASELPATGGVQTRLDTYQSFCGGDSCPGGNLGPSRINGKIVMVQVTF